MANMPLLFVLGQIGDVKTAERYFQEVEKACQIKASQQTLTTCMLMNRYVYVSLAPHVACERYAAQWTQCLLKEVTSVVSARGDDLTPSLSADAHFKTRTADLV